MPRPAWHCRKFWMDATQPAEYQAGQQAATAAADRDRDTNNLELDHADKHTDEHTDTEENEVSDLCCGDLVTDFQLHAIEVNRTADEV